MVKSHSIWHRLLICVGCIAYTVPLAGYALNGSFMRYSGDDYCYGGILARYGFWKAQWLSYWQITLYHGNRFSLTLFSDLVGLFDPKANGVLPALVMVLWLIGIVLILWNARKVCFPDLDWGSLFFMAEVFTFLVLHQAPDLVQSLYWRSAMLPYSMPITFNLYIGAIVLQQVLRARIWWPTTGLLFLLSFVSAGFSETGAAMQAGLWGAFCITAVLFWKRERGKSVRLWLLCGSVLMGTIAATVLLALSPVTRLRLMNLPPPPGALSLLKMSLMHTRIFLAVTRKQTWSNLVMMFVPLCLSFYCSAKGLTTATTFKTLVQALVFIGLVSLFLVFCCMVPSAYAESSYPELRVLILARFVVVAGVVTACWKIGTFIEPQIKGRLLYAGVLGASVLVLVATYSYPLIWAKSIYAEMPRYQKWAHFWDARDQQIREAQRQGVSQIEVVQIDHIVPRVGELSPDPGYWYNVCASWYYGIHSISANQPGWDE